MNYTRGYILNACRLNSLIGLEFDFIIPPKATPIPLPSQTKSCSPFPPLIYVAQPAIQPVRNVSAHQRHTAQTAPRTPSWKMALARPGAQRNNTTITQDTVSVRIQG